MKRVSHAVEAGLVHALSALFRTLPAPVALGLGAGLGDLAHGLGLRARVARDNLALAFPDRTPEARAAILAAHYRELGRVASEYPRMPAMVHAPIGAYLGGVRGVEHLERARAAGRGALLLTGHYGNFEMLGAWLGRMQPVDFVVKPLSNPHVDRWIESLRRAAGVGTLPLGAGVRGVYRALRANHWIALLADQDARSDGVFVPFFGRPASTPRGPAELAVRTGAPIVMGFGWRDADGRHQLEIGPTLTPDPGLADPEAAVRDLTARHTAALEARVRERPEQWFWLHRRWKTAPPDPGAARERIGA
jgi:KDO2-lipid IV(A) lauroyltransferase